MNKLKHQGVLNIVPVFCYIWQSLDCACISPVLMIQQPAAISFQQGIDIVLVGKKYSGPKQCQELCS